MVSHLNGKQTLEKFANHTFKLLHVFMEVRNIFEKFIKIILWLYKKIYKEIEKVEEKSNSSI